MTALLEKALAQLNDLPEASQDVIASQILDAIEDERWERTLASKRDVLERMAQEAREEARRGEARSLEDML